MCRLALIAPTSAHFPDLLAYKRSFLAKNLQIHGSSGLDRFNDDELDRYLEYVYSPAGTNWFGYETVEADTYLAWEKTEQRLVGMINIRYHLSEYLHRVGGHIGYSINPADWNKGYATEMLSLALAKTDERGLSTVLITCDKCNPASAKVIIKNGGVLENEVEEDGEIIQRYWISR